MVDIRKFMDKAFSDEFFQGHLGQTFDIHGAAAGEKGKGLDLFGWTFRIRTYKDLCIDLPADLRFSPAHRTDLRDLQGPGPGQILRDLGNDHVGLVDGQPVADPQLQGAHNADIVDGSPLYGRSLQFHGLENGNGIDQACAAGAPLHFFQSSLLLLVRPFKGNGVAGELSCPAQRIPIGDVIQQKDQAVRRNIKSRNLLFKKIDLISYGLSGHNRRLHRFKALVLQEPELLQTGIVKVRNRLPER